MKKIGWALAAPIVAISLPLMLIAAVFASGTTSTCTPPVSLTTLHLTSTQANDATTIASLAMQAGGPQAALVAITTALTESRLGADGGSTGGADGVFQQTPPTWGTLAQVTNLTHATNAFLTHLLAVPGWQTMPAWKAAQAVQGSGAGKKTDGKANYGPHVGTAQQIVAAIINNGATAIGCTSPTAGGKSDFTTNTQVAYVGPYNPAQLYARAQAYDAANRSPDPDPYFHTVTAPNYWLGRCQAFAGNMAGLAKSGWPNAAAGWAGLLQRGDAHPASSSEGMSPPPGAWLYYDTGKTDGHVAVYLGGGLVAGTDTWGEGNVGIGPASDLTNGRWHLTYLGWATPTPK